MPVAAWPADEARNAFGTTTTTSERRGSWKGRKPEAQARNEEYIAGGKETSRRGRWSHRLWITRMGDPLPVPTPQVARIAHGVPRAAPAPTPPVAASPAHVAPSSTSPPSPANSSAGPPPPRGTRSLAPPTTPEAYGGGGAGEAEVPALAGINDGEVGNGATSRPSPHDSRTRLHASTTSSRPPSPHCRAVESFHWRAPATGGGRRPARPHPLPSHAPRVSGTRGWSSAGLLPDTADDSYAGASSPHPSARTPESQRATLGCRRSPRAGVPPCPLLPHPSSLPSSPRVG